MFQRVWPYGKDYTLVWNGHEMIQEQFAILWDVRKQEQVHKFKAVDPFSDGYQVQCQLPGVDGEYREARGRIASRRRLYRVEETKVRADMIKKWLPKDVNGMPISKDEAMDASAVFKKEEVVKGNFAGGGRWCVLCV